jgi:hypothetical protein
MSATVEGVAGATRAAAGAESPPLQFQNTAISIFLKSALEQQRSSLLSGALTTLTALDGGTDASSAKLEAGADDSAFLVSVGPALRKGELSAYAVSIISQLVSAAVKTSQGSHQDSASRAADEQRDDSLASPGRAETPQQGWETIHTSRPSTPRSISTPGKLYLRQHKQRARALRVEKKVAYFLACLLAWGRTLVFLSVPLRRMNESSRLCISIFVSNF